MKRGFADFFGAAAGINTDCVKRHMVGQQHVRPIAQIPASRIRYDWVRGRGPSSILERRDDKHAYHCLWPRKDSSQKFYLCSSIVRGGPSLYMRLRARLALRTFVLPRLFLTELHLGAGILFTDEGLS